MKILPVQEQYNLSSARPVRNKNISMAGVRTSVKKGTVCRIKNSKIFQAIKESFINYFDRINYTWQHKKAILKVEKELCGKNSISAVFHDLDKLFMYIIGIPGETAHNIHLRIAPHHVRKGHVKKPLMAVLDWECARYTKPDKPLSAREFYESYYVKEKNMRIPEIEKVLEKLGL